MIIKYAQLKFFFRDQEGERKGLKYNTERNLNISIYRCF